MDLNYDFDELLKVPNWALNPQMLARAREAWNRIYELMAGGDLDTLGMNTDEIGYLQIALQRPAFFFKAEWLLPESDTVALAIEECKRSFKRGYDIAIEESKKKL